MVSDIIWNISLLCPWDCSICCVNATQTLKNELSLKDKLKIIDNLEDYNLKIDFSGGDPLMLKENLEVMKYASKKFGKENILVSTTGIGLSKINQNELSKYISKIEFNYDKSRLRPKDYNESNLNSAKLITTIKTSAQVPLFKSTIRRETLTSLYLDLHNAGIQRMDLLRFFPVGRAVNVNEMPSKKDYLTAIEIFRNLESKLKFPEVNLQCALKGLEGSYEINPCDLFRGGMSINSKGILITSAWAMNKKGEPLHDMFILGSLLNNKISELLSTERADIYITRLDENFGHCKLFSYFNSEKLNLYDKLFDRADPLYV